MKTILILALAVAAAGSAGAQPAVSIGIHQPGVYGRINIGELPQPALVRAQPVIVAPPREAIPRRPIYMYVPADHQQNWGRYCGRYNACGQPVYFVQDRWVRERYAEQNPGWDRRYHGPDHRDDRHDRHDDRRDDRRDDRH